MATSKATKLLCTRLQVFPAVPRFTEHTRKVFPMLMFWLWHEIMDAKTPTWKHYHQKYKKLYNELRSKLVSLCDESTN